MAQRILVVGGSLGGLFAAVLLHRAGFDVTVTERSVHGLGGRGAGLVAQQEVFDILRDVGFERAAQIGVVASERIHLDQAGNIVHVQRTPQTQLSWDVLFDSFRALLPDTRYRTGQQVLEVSAEVGGARVRYADGREEVADLVIGADGIGSVVRAAVNGPQAQPDYVGYATWRGLVPETHVPSDAARQLFGRMAFHDMPGSQTLGYLVAGADGSSEVGARRYNWVWYRRYTVDELDRVLTDIDGTRRPFSLAPGRVRADAVATLHEDAVRLLPPSFAAAVQAESRPFVHAIFDYTSPRMVSGRIALLGDAAFVARPHTAMGVGKAAADAMALRDALTGSASLNAGLSAYEATRAPVDRAIVAYGQRLGRSLASAPA